MKAYALGGRFGGIIHGGDYNPEQWSDRPDVLEKDIVYMKEAGINEATLGVFSWAVYEPREGEYDFDWLIRTMDRLYENGIKTILATPSGARPAWLDHKYPEVMRVNGVGIRNRHGFRHNHCLTSPVFRDKVRNIDERLAKAVGDHPGFVAWHISNEFGGECFCDLCAEKFRKYLAKKFDNDIDRLNHEWWTTFWSAKYNGFSEIEPPYENGQTAVMGLNLEWKRFTTMNFADFLDEEVRAVRSAGAKRDIPVTTNFMKRYDGIDYRVLADHIDFISWDSYPAFHNDRESYEDTMLESTFDHAVMRGMKKDRPFLLMESSPGQINWMPYNKLKRPHVNAQFAVQALGCGSDSVQYFQWRRSRGAAEQFHGAVIDHDGGNDTRVFREVAATGRILKALAPVEGSCKKSHAAIIFEWDNRWAIEGLGGFSAETKKYDRTCMDYWKALMKYGIEADVISVRDSFSDYRLIIAPMLFLVREETAKKLSDYVADGGTVLATYMTGYINENCLCHEGGFPGGGLKELFGITSEEIDTLYPSDENAIVMDGSGSRLKVRDYAELLRVGDAEVIGRYADDFYAESAALTCRKHGKGSAYYQAARVLPDGLFAIMDIVLAQAGIDTAAPPAGIEFHRRYGEDALYDFYLNLTDKDVALPGLAGRDMISGEAISGEALIPAGGYLVIESAYRSR